MRLIRVGVVCCSWCGWLFAAHGGPAVLLKNYSAQIIRGHYLLGNRLIRVGEIVTVRAVRDFDAQVTTADGDPFMVSLTDLRPLPATSALVRHAATSHPAALPVPTPAPASTPAAKPSPGPDAKSADTPAGARREVAVRCSHLTKKGTQCTRMTFSPNGCCWQHGGD